MTNFEAKGATVEAPSRIDTKSPDLHPDWQKILSDGIDTEAFDPKEVLAIIESTPNGGKLRDDFGQGVYGLFEVAEKNRGFRRDDREPTPVPKGTQSTSPITVDSLQG